MMKKLNLVALTALALFANACGEDSGDEKTNDESDAVEIDKADVVKQYSKIVYASMQDSVQAAEALYDAAHELIEHPSQETLDAAREAWLAAREPYLQTEVYRFYNGPIEESEGMINAWPLDELYIDYGVDAPNAGIINDPEQEISADALAKLNEQGGEENIATGFHAIEFLLWGQDDTKPGTGAGKRPLSDYVDGAQGGTNQARRRTYLKDVTQLLIDDLEPLVAAWAPDKADNFRGTFGALARDPKTQPDAKKEAIGDLLRSMGSMAKAELSGERMTVAFKNRSEEDEHSCFSDTTASDLLGNGVGIENVWLGRHGSFDGVGVDEVVRAIDADLAAKTTADLADSVAKLRKLEALQTAGTPIDVILQAADDSEGRKAMLEAIKALKLVAEDTEKAARALGLSIAIEDPSEDL